MKLTLRVWRQKNADTKGKMVKYQLDDVEEDMSFLEMLDVLNEKLVLDDEEPVSFDHDCREGICGSCAMVINGIPHGPQKNTTTCQLHMRHFKDGDTIDVEPWRARAFPVIKDLVTDRSAFDQIIQAGGYVSVNTGSAPEAHATPVDKVSADDAFDAATCIACGACVAACPNGSSMLFTAAKVTHLGLLPQGQPERADARDQHARQAGRARLRRVHQRRGVRRGVPQGHPAGDDLAAQPRRAGRDPRGGALGLSGRASRPGPHERPVRHPRR